MADRNSDRKTPHLGKPVADTWFTVTDAVQGRLLTDVPGRHFFEPFLARERTVSEAAAEVGCSVDAMYYRVQKLLKAGLLVVARTEARAGKALKHYRSNADAYVIPFSLTPSATLEEHLAEQLAEENALIARSFAAVLRLKGLEGRRLYRHADGQVWSDAAVDPAVPFSSGGQVAPVAHDFSVRLKLGQEDARRLQEELHRLYEHYSALVPRGGSEYIWRVALVPEPKS